MSLVQELVKQHAAFLKIKGFTEENLHTEERPGRFIKEYESKLIQAMDYSRMFNRVDEFSVAMTGWIKSPNDPVRFELGYRYDPAKIDAELTSITIRVNNQTKIHDVKDADLHQLPTTNAFYQDIIVERARKIASLTADLSIRPTIKKKVG